MKITWDMVARAAEKPNYAAQNIGGPINPFAPYEPMPGVLPEGRTAQMAMDDIGFSGIAGWAGSGVGGWGSNPAFLEGQTFLGYPELAMMSQRPEYRMISEAYADEATRKWGKFKAKSENEDKASKIKAIEDEFERLDVRGAFRKCAEIDGLQGRAHIYLDTGDTDDPQELSTNLGDSFSTVSRGKVSPERPLRAIRVVEAMWCYPSFYNTVNPLKKDWYKPNHWFVMGQQLHASRFLTFLSREVPDMMKPAYAFGGLSLSQMVKPYIDNWLVTRQSVQDLIKGFSTFVLKTNMSAAYSGVGGDDFFRRADMFNMMRTNRGLMMLDKDTEEFANISAPLSGLDHLQAQSQEHCASVAQIPLVKYTGISPSGLNASSEGELRCWEDRIHSFQEALFDKHLRVIMNFVMLSLWGEIDEGITFEWLPINELTEKEQAELHQLQAQTDAGLVEIGAIDAHEVRGRIANDESSPYAGLDVDDMPEPPGGGMEGMMPGMEDMEGGEPGAEGEADQGDPALEAEEEAEEPGAEAAAAPPKPGHHPALDPNAPRGHPAFTPQGEPHPALKLPKPKPINVSAASNSKSEGGFKPAKDSACCAHDEEPKFAQKRRRKLTNASPETE